MSQEENRLNNADEENEAHMSLSIIIDKDLIRQEIVPLFVTPQKL